MTIELIRHIATWSADALKVDDVETPAFMQWAMDEATGVVGHTSDMFSVLGVPSNMSVGGHTLVEHSTASALTLGFLIGRAYEEHQRLHGTGTTRAEPMAGHAQAATDQTRHNLP
jgi:hypothetical protein